MNEKNMQRNCARCDNVKNLEDFPKAKNKYLGYGHTCKSCVLIYGKEYAKSVNGVINYLYYGQRNSSNYRKMPMPNYSKLEFKEWLLKQANFQDLYNNWIKGNYAKDLKPSVDRINDYLPYSFDNIQLLTWKENHANSGKDKINGINNKQSKPVLQFDRDGNFLKEFYSAAQASRVTGANNKNITFCCQNKPKYKTALGYIWKYKIIEELDKNEK